MATPLYWVEGPWPGKLAMAPRPRGGDWLHDEIEGWRRSKIKTVLSLLTPEEEHALDLDEERGKTKAGGIQFISFPIPDREVPEAQAEVAAVVDQVNSELSSGDNVLIHCRQGVGRSGLLAACLLVSRGVDSNAAMERLSKARGLPVPETAEQRRWINRYAASLTTK